jgi:hypothetical protein
MVPQDAVRFGHALRDRHHLTEEFAKDVRVAFLKSLVIAYWDAITAYMVKAGWPVKEAVRHVGIAPSTHSRWGRETTPSFENICLMFSGCDLNLRDVSFPTAQDAFKSALLRTVEHIRKKYLDQQQSATLGDAEWLCLCRALGSSEILQKTLADPTANADQVTGAWHVACEGIGEEVSRLTDGRIKDADQVLRTIQDWIRPLVLFYTVIPPARRGN